MGRTTWKSKLPMRQFNCGSTLLTCQHNVEHKKGEQYAKHANKFEERKSRNVAILLLFCRLDQCGKHNAKAKKIADVCKVNVKIPTKEIDVIKNAKAGNTAYKTECAINGLKDQLCCSAFDHSASPLILFVSCKVNRRLLYQPLYKHSAFKISKRPLFWTSIF